jgi:hypothetical protein
MKVESKNNHVDSFSSVILNFEARRQRFFPARWLSLVFNGHGNEEIRIFDGRSSIRRNANQARTSRTETIVALGWRFYSHQSE